MHLFKFSVTGLIRHTDNDDKDSEQIGDWRRVQLEIIMFCRANSTDTHQCIEYLAAVHLTNSAALPLISLPCSSTSSGLLNTISTPDAAWNARPSPAISQSDTPTVDYADTHSWMCYHRIQEKNIYQKLICTALFCRKQIRGRKNS